MNDVIAMGSYHVVMIMKTMITTKILDVTTSGDGLFEFMDETTYLGASISGVHPSDCLTHDR